MTLDTLRECIESGKCISTVFTSKNCPYCPELKEKLDELGIPYEEKIVDENIAKKHNITSVPVMHLKNNGNTMVVQNYSLDTLRELLDNLEF